MVLNQTAAMPEGWQKDERPAIPAHARSVWEVHVADFTADPASGVPQAYRGKFMGFTVDGTTLNGDGVHPTGLNYLKRSTARCACGNAAPWSRPCTARGWAW